MKNNKIMIIANDTTYTYNLRKELLEEFIKKGNDVIVVATKDKYAEEIKGMGIMIINIDIFRHGTNPCSDLIFFFRILWVLMNNKPNIVFTFNIKPNIYGGIACNLLNLPFIPNITGLGGALVNDGIIKMITKLLYKFGILGVNEVLFQNQDNKNYFMSEKIIGKQKESYTLPGSGINLDKINFNDYPKDEVVIKFLTVCRIMKDKGVDELLNSIKHIKKIFGSKVEFYIAGSYDDLTYKTIFEEMVHTNYMTYLGQVNNVPKLMKDFHCIIHPSYHEGISNVLLEAGAIGRPVIASDIPGCRETFIDGESGFAVKVRDSNDLISKIEQFINLPYETKKEMGKINRAHVEKNFDRKIVVKKYIECIEKYAK